MDFSPGFEDISSSELTFFSRRRTHLFKKDTLNNKKIHQILQTDLSNDTFKIILFLIQSFPQSFITILRIPHIQTNYRIHL